MGLHKYSFCNDRSTMRFMVEPSTGNKYLWEEFMTDSGMITEIYQINGFSKGDYDKRLIYDIEYAIENNVPKTIMYRWTNEYDPNTFLGSGNFYISSSITCKGKRVLLIFETSHTIDNKEYRNTYGITGHSKINKLLEVLKYTAN